MRASSDYIAAFFVCAAWVVSTCYLFLHPSDMNFVTWISAGGTWTCVFHGLALYDDKKADAPK